MPPVLGPVSLSPTRLKSCAGSSGTTVSPSTMLNSDTSGPSRNDSSSTGWPASSRLAACARAASRSAVTTTPLPAASPSSLTTHAGSPADGPEPVERPVEVCRVVDDLAGRCSHPGRGHHIFGERLRTFDARGVLRRPEAGDACGAHCVGDTEDKRHLGPDDHQVGADSSEPGRATASPEVMSTSYWSAMIAVPALPGRDGQLLHLGVLAQRQQQRMFTGSGSDHEDAHRLTLTGSDAP